MRNFFSYYIGGLLSFSTLIFAGCGRETAPPPPTLKQKIVLDTLTALEHRDHQLALKKIARLRELDPTNVFLANLEILERNNSIIKKAQEKIDDNNLNEALNVVTSGIRKYGRHDDLMNVEKKLKVITRIDELLKVFSDPRDSAQLNAAATQLIKIAEIYKPASMFLPLAKKKLAEAAVMNEWENRRAVIDLVSEIDTLQKAGDNDAALLYAILENVDPTNPALINYLEYLNDNDSVDLTIYPEENIFANDDNDEETESNEIEEGPQPPTTNNENNKNQEEVNQEKKEKESSWWNKFSF